MLEKHKKDIKGGRFKTRKEARDAFNTAMLPLTAEIFSWAMQKEIRGADQGRSSDQPLERPVPVKDKPPNLDPVVPVKDKKSPNNPTKDKKPVKDKKPEKPTKDKEPLKDKK
jgi:hypothetical protein